jgi:hypothetical protein
VDVYSGELVVGPGSYTRAGGRVTLAVASAETGEAGAGQETRPTYDVTIQLRSRPCPRSRRHRRCLRLDGGLHGEAITDQRNPPVADLPDVAHMPASGYLKGLGAVTATVAFWGTGYIARGRLTATVRIRTAKGTLWIEANGPTVRGFSPPLGCSPTSCRPPAPARPARRG